MKFKVPAAGVLDVTALGVDIVLVDVTITGTEAVTTGLALKVCAPLPSGTGELVAGVVVIFGARLQAEMVANKAMMATT